MSQSTVVLIIRLKNDHFFRVHFRLQCERLYMFRFCIPLPGRDHIGRKVVYINTGGYDPNVISLNEVFRVQLMTIDTLIQDEHIQVKEYHLRFPFKDN